MDYTNILNELKKRNQTLIEKYTKLSDKRNTMIQNEIKNILSTDHPFSHLNMETSFNILKDLKFSYKESLEIYQVLI